jgi:hypothetical protein
MRLHHEVHEEHEEIKGEKQDFLISFPEFILVNK